MLYMDKVVNGRTVSVPRFINPYNFTEVPLEGEVSDKPSQTVPDQALSIQQILDRYSRGLPFSGSYDPVYFGDDWDLADFSKMDFADQEAYLEANRAEIKRMQAELQETRRKGEEAYRKHAQGAAASQYPKKTPPEAPPAGPAEPTSPAKE